MTQYGPPKLDILTGHLKEIQLLQYILNQYMFNFLCLNKTTTLVAFDCMLNIAVWVWGNYLNSFGVDMVPDKFLRKGANVS